MCAFHLGIITTPHLGPSGEQAHAHSMPMHDYYLSNLAFDSILLQSATPLSKLNRLSRIKALRLRKVVASLIRNESGLMRLVFEIAVEMRVSERPHGDTIRGEAQLLRQIGHEARGQGTALVLGVDGPRIVGRSVVCHDDNLAGRFFFLERVDLRVEPAQLGLVLLHMRLHGPVLDVVEVVEAEADGVFLRSGDVGEERAAEKGRCGRDVVPRLVQEDEFPVCLV